MSKRLTVIIPVYNEAENLDRVEDEFSRFFKIAKVPTSVLFVNDGSTDNSQTKIKFICSDSPHFNYIQFDRNYGLSTALKAGFDCVTTELVGYIDADLQTHPQDLNVLLQHIDNYEMVTGYRQNRQDTYIKKISSKIANKIRRLIINDRMKDTGCPLKIMYTDYAKRLPMFRGLHRFLPAMLELQNATIKQVPIRHYPRNAGKSKFGIRNRTLGPLIDCFAVLWMQKKHLKYVIKSSSIKS